MNEKNENPKAYRGGLIRTLAEQHKVRGLEYTVGDAAEVSAAVAVLQNALIEGRIEYQLPTIIMR